MRLFRIATFTTVAALFITSAAAMTYEPVAPTDLFGHGLTVFTYTASPKEGWGDGSITASGTKPAPGTVAVSRDLFKQGWTFGRKVQVGHEVLVITDLMHRKHRRALDRFCRTKQEAKDWGGKKRMTVFLLPEPARTAGSKVLPQPKPHEMAFHEATK